MDKSGHGTYVAGIIGAMGNNGIGVAGVNWNVGILPVRFMDQTGTVAAEIKAIEYAISAGARIINASYGDRSFSRTEYEAVKYAGEQGILFVAAAGNKGNNNDSTEKSTLLDYKYRNYPASYSIENTIGAKTYPPLANIISVAWSDSSDSLASSSNYGATSVHLAAPGENICSTGLNGAYTSKSGTSMATPFVSGTAALLLSEKPDATLSQVKEAILQSADPVPGLQGKVSSGGRLNAHRALQKIQELPPPSIPLQKGWNFISTHLESENPSMDGMLKDISSNVRVIWGYDNMTKVWERWTPSTPCPSPSALCSIEAGKGYWIYMDTPKTLDISNPSPRPEAVSLYPGWNLVGYQGADGTVISNELPGMGNEWIILWSWSGGEWYGKHASLTDLPIQPLNTLNRKRAYWIKVVADPPVRMIEWVQ